MGRKKQKTGEVSALSKASSPQPPRTEKTIGANSRTIAAMGIGGAVLGFLSGLNQWPAIPAELASPEASAAWLGAVLGQPRLDVTSAVQGGFLGMAVGLGTASSFNFGLGRMLKTWVLAGGGLMVGALTLKTAMAAAGGWILGWLMAQAGSSSSN